MEKLQTLDTGHLLECPASETAPPPKPQPDRADLTAVCRENPELDLLVLLHPIDGAVGNVWVPPVPFEEPGLITGDLAGVRAERFYIYACNALRRS
jgi:hypothetical protein